MKTSPGSRRRFQRTDGPRRAKLLAAFERSGLSAAAFARQHGLNYTTFCGWRHQRVKTKPPACAEATAGRSSGFVPVELPKPAASVDLSAEASAKAELVIELGPPARMRLNSASQIELVARLLQALNPTAPC